MTNCELPGPVSAVATQMVQPGYATDRDMMKYHLDDYVEFIQRTCGCGLGHSKVSPAPSSGTYATYPCQGSHPTHFGTYASLFDVYCLLTPTYVCG